jgi:hypothetical protein
MKKLFLAATLLAACGGGAKSTVRAPGDTTPDWVAQGTGAVEAESGKAVQAVGSAAGPDAKARRQKADAAARAQLDRVVGQLSASLARLGDPKQGDAIGTLTRRAATDAQQIRDHWVTSDGTEMSLDVLDLSGFKAALARQDADDKLKKDLSANADKAFDSIKGK